MQRHQVATALLPGGVRHVKAEGIDLHLEGDNARLAICIQWLEWIMDLSFLQHLENALHMAHKHAWEFTTLTRPTAPGALEDQLKENFTLMAFAIKQQMTAVSPFGSTTLKPTAHVKLGMSACDLWGGNWSFLGDSNGICMLFVDMKEPMSESIKTEAMVETVNMAPGIEQPFLINSIISRRSSVFAVFCL